jgi:hypothetical protein
MRPGVADTATPDVTWLATPAPLRQLPRRALTRGGRWAQQPGWARPGSAQLGWAHGVGAGAASRTATAPTGCGLARGANSAPLGQLHRQRLQAPLSRRGTLGGARPGLAQLDSARGADFASTTPTASRVEAGAARVATAPIGCGLARDVCSAHDEGAALLPNKNRRMVSTWCFVAARPAASPALTRTPRWARSLEGSTRTRLDSARPPGGWLQRAGGLHPAST